MEKFNYIYIFACMLNVLHLSHGSSLGRLKRSSHSLQFNLKRAEYEREQYEAYSSNTDLYTEWPELNISDLLNEESCKIYIRKLFPKKNFEKCSITPSIKPVKLFYVSTIYSSLGLLIRGPIRLNSLECHIDPSTNRRKYFHFIRASNPECIYLINRRKQGSRNFTISLGFCKNHTYADLKSNKGLEGAVYKQKPLKDRKISRDNDTIKEQEEYEKNHQLWLSQDPVEAYSWPEVQSENQRFFCRKLLGKLYPKSTILLEEIDPSYYLAEIKYTKLKNNEGIEFPLVQVFAFHCKMKQKMYRSTHTFIKAPDHGLSSCVYMIRRERNIGRYLQIIKRLCIQKLYEKKVTTGVNEQMNNENILEPNTFKENSENSLRPTQFEEDLITDEEILRHIICSNSTVSIDELLKSTAY